jgi:hypothetical protein
MESVFSSDRGGLGIKTKDEEKYDVTGYDTRLLVVQQDIDFTRVVGGKLVD